MSKQRRDANKQDRRRWQAAVKAAQAVYKPNPEYGLTDADMEAAIRAAVAALDNDQTPESDMCAMKSDAAATDAFGDVNYKKMPKSVLALIAYSFAQRLAGDAHDRDLALAEIAREWDALHANGIVPQKPAKLETREEEARRIDSYPATHGGAA